MRSVYLCTALEAANGGGDRQFILVTSMRTRRTLRIWLAGCRAAVAGGCQRALLTGCMVADLSGKVALVAGATRGCGRAIAVELARVRAYVFATGRSSRAAGRSEIGRPETIEETGEMMAAAGGHGVALRVDHLEPGEVSALVERVDAEQGRLDILVNDIFGGDAYAEFDKKIWEHDLPGGLRMLRMGIDTHLITAALALPLMLRHPGGLVIEMTDGTFEYNKNYRKGVGFYYDPGQGSCGADHDRAHG